MGESSRSSKRRRDDDEDSPEGANQRDRSRSRSPARGKDKGTDREPATAIQEDASSGAGEAKKRKRRRWDSSTADGDDATGPATAPKLDATQMSGLGINLTPAGAIKATPPAVSLSQKLAAPGGASNIEAAVAKAQEAARIQKQIQERLKGIGGLSGLSAIKAQTQARLADAAAALKAQQAKAQQKKWAPLLLDKQGRQIDEHGKLVVMEKEATATLKVNMRSQLAAAEAQKELYMPTPTREQAKSHSDPRLDAAPKERERRSLHFVKPGKYIARAQTMRMKQISREMRSQQFDTTEEGIVRREMDLAPIPDVEWWDQPLLDGSSYEAPQKEDAITNYIHVPVLLDPVAELPPPPPMQMMLTQKEKKKIKRIQKKEKQREEADKIRLGLIEPPEPKMRLSNLMRVLGDDAIMEPSKMEAKVRKQMSERQAKHAEHNASRQLTDEQKKEKKRKKLMEDTNIETHVAVFRAGDLTDPRRRFKVDVHATQFNLTGAAVIYGNCNVVAVEGGPKAIKKFTRLMLHRIKWVPEEHEDQEEEVEESDEDGEGSKKKVYKKCALVWQGVLNKRSFRTFRFEHCRQEASARKIFKDKQVPQYWDMCRNYVES